MREPWANPTDIRQGGEMDFSENDLREIERERDLPPDEPAQVPPSYATARLFLVDAADYLTEPDPEAALRAAKEAIALIEGAL